MEPVQPGRGGDARAGPRARASDIRTARRDDVVERRISTGVAPAWRRTTSRRRSSPIPESHSLSPGDAHSDADAHADTDAACHGDADGSYADEHAHPEPTRRPTRRAPVLRRSPELHAPADATPSPTATRASGGRRWPARSATTRGGRAVPESRRSSRPDRPERRRPTHAVRVLLGGAGGAFLRPAKDGGAGEAVSSLDAARCCRPPSECAISIRCRRWRATSPGTQRRP